MTEQFDLFGCSVAEAARDHALAQVAEHAGDWMEQAASFIDSLRAGYCGTGEEIRLRLLWEGLDEPHHPGCWGAAIRDAIKRGSLGPTGRFKPMTTRKSHARLTQILERTHN